MQNAHFLLDKLNKPIFHNNFDFFFFMYPYIHASNTLFIDDTPWCFLMIHHTRVCLMNCLVSSFWSLLTMFVRMTIICRKLFSFTWNFFIYLDMVFPHLYNIIPLIGLDVLIAMILENIKCYLWNAIMVVNPHLVTMWNWKWNK